MVPLCSPPQDATTDVGGAGMLAELGGAILNSFLPMQRYKANANFRQSWRRSCPFCPAPGSYVPD